MRTIFSLFARSEFSRNVMTLMPGTVFSQAVPIVFSILLARIYAPEIFGLYFLFTALLGLCIIVATGKYELAILLPARDADAARIIGLALSVCLSFCAFLFALFLLISPWIAGWLGSPHFGRWLPVLPLSVLLSAANETFYYWHNRKKRYRVLAAAKITQSLTGALIQLGIGLILATETGLILGLLAGQAASAGWLWWNYWRQDARTVSFTLFRGLKALAGKYAAFPRDIALASLVNEANNQIPNLFFARYLGQAVVGHYGYAQRTLRTPLGVVSNAFSDVFKARAAEAVASKDGVKGLFVRTFTSLALLSVVPFILLFFFSPVLFRWVFGEAFATAGIYARIFSVPLFLGFVISPLTSAFYILGRTRAFLLIQLTGLALVVVSILTAYLLSGDSRTIMICLAGAVSVTYLLSFGLLWRYVSLVKPEH